MKLIKGLPEEELQNSLRMQAENEKALVSLPRCVLRTFRRAGLPDEAVLVGITRTP